MIFQRGDWVEKIGGDYTFSGRVLWCGLKFKDLETLEDGKPRVIVQNREGLCHIFAPAQLRHIDIFQEAEHQYSKDMSMSDTPFKGRS